MRSIIVIVALALLMQGFAYLLIPAQMFALFGASSVLGEAMTDQRATYGGVHIAIAIFLFRNSHSSGGRRTAFELLTVLLACVAGIRAAGIAIDGGNQALNLAATAIEISLACFTAACAVRIRNQEAADAAT